MSHEGYIIFSAFSEEQVIFQIYKKQLQKSNLIFEKKIITTQYTDIITLNLNKTRKLNNKFENKLQNVSIETAFIWKKRQKVLDFCYF